MPPNQIEDCNFQIQKCKEVLGLNFFILIENHWTNIREAFEKNDYIAVASAAVPLLETLQRQGQFELHLSMGNTIIEILKPISPNLILSRIHRQLAVTCDMKNYFKQSENHFVEAINNAKHFAESGDKDAIEELSGIWYNRSQIARNGESDEQLSVYVDKSLKLCENTNDLRGVALALSRKSTLLPDSEVKRKVELNEKVLKIGETINDEGMIVLAQMNLGHAEAILGNHKYGIALIRNAVSLIEKNASWQYIGLGYLHLAETLAIVGMKQEAQNEFDYAISIFNKYGIEVYEAKVASVKEKIDAL